MEETATIATIVQLPYCCVIEITLPSAQIADQIRRILQVDKEIGDRAVKTYSVLNNCLQVSVRAETAKLLRVVVSSFYEYLQVSLKAYQEFYGGEE